MNDLWCSCDTYQELCKVVRAVEARNHGKAWTCDDKARLRKEFGHGMSLVSLCAQFGRTPVSITSALQTMGLLMYDPGSGFFKIPAPSASRPTNPVCIPESLPMPKFSAPILRVKSRLFINDVQVSELSELSGK